MLHTSSRLLKFFLLVSLPLPMMFGALIFGLHHGVIEWPAVVISWGSLSLVSIGSGLWVVIKLSAPVLLSQEEERTTDSASSLKAAPADVDDLEFGNLGDRRALFDVFMDHLPALAFIKDSHGRYLYINSACNEMLKMDPGDVIGRRDCDLWPKDSADIMCQNDDHIITDNQVYSAIESFVIDGAQHHHLVTKFGILNDRQPPLLGGIVFDITEKVCAEQENANLEQQLIQSQKMEAIGTLAGGIAHDFNNVLAAIMGYVELAMLDAPPGSGVQDQLDHVLKAANRATDLVRQILTFSRKTGQERQPLDPEPLVDEALKLIRATLPTTIEIRQHFEGNGALVLANATQLHQVIINICTNAAHAMEENGGVIDVHLKTTSYTDVEARLHGVSPGRYLEISIDDSGHGIPAAIKQRIFDPYYTTKAQGKGSGMGLAVAAGIVQSHGGAIDVQSEPGTGTCFRVLFPLTTDSILPLSERTVSLPTGTESVLFVDDEPVLVDLGREMLTRLGYKVTCCEGSQEALALFQKDPNQFDLVITDATMPNMTGDVLVSRLLALRPDIPVLLCTGYSEQITHEKAARIGITAFLMKPLSIGDLALTLRSTLDARIIQNHTPFLKIIGS